jgi:hypothetical protein
MALVNSRAHFRYGILPTGIGAKQLWRQAALGLNQNESVHAVGDMMGDH